MADNIMNILSQYIPHQFHSAINNFMRQMPKIIIGIAIIVIGIRLIIGKKRECKIDA